MKVLKIVTAPNPILDNPSKSVTKIDSKIKKLVEDMEATLIAQTDPQGVGLAAVQIGIPLQLFIIKHTPKAKTQVMINPKIISNSATGDGKDSEESDFLRLRSSETGPDGAKKLLSSKQLSKNKEKSSLEGCLSIPRIWAPVKRQPKITLTYQDLSGTQKTAEFTGLQAIIVQHEMDHLKGTLFTKRALSQKSTLYEEVNGKLEKMTY